MSKKKIIKYLSLCAVLGTQSGYAFKAESIDMSDSSSKVSLADLFRNMNNGTRSSSLGLSNDLAFSANSLDSEEPTDYKGTEWRDIHDPVDIFNDPVLDVKVDLNNISNNAYYLDKFLEGENKGSLSGDELDNFVSLHKGGLIEDIYGNSATGVSGIQADVTNLNREITTKAEQSEVEANTDAIKLKADASTLTDLETNKVNVNANAITDLQKSVDSKVDQIGVYTAMGAASGSSIIDTRIGAQIVSGGSIFTAIGGAAEDGGAIAEDIKKQVADKSGSVYDSIVSGSSIVVDSKLADYTNTDDLNTLLADKADKSDVATNTTDITTLGATKANVADVYTKTDSDSKYYTQAQATVDLGTKLNTSAAGGVVLDTMKLASGSTIIDTRIGTQIASGGSIFTAIGGAAEDGGAIATDIENQVSLQSGSVYRSIVSGSSVAISDSLNSVDEGTIGKAIDGKLDASIYNSVVGTTDTEGLRSKVQANFDAIGNSNIGLVKDVADNKTAIASKADAVNVTSNTTEINTLKDKVNDTDTGLDTKLDATAVNAEINTSVASGTIANAIDTATKPSSDSDYLRSAIKTVNIGTEIFSINLPSAGTYVISYGIRAEQDTPGDWFVYSLYDGSGTKVEGTETEPFHLIV